MCDAIRHRGPDDWGTFVEDGVGLGMRRLSIIDLAGGHQPIANEDGDLQVVFNGEIYNHEELRKDLIARGHRFRTRTDTEVLVHLFEDHGERMLQRLRGMFAFAIWDRRRRRLFVARDHFGQKPLFYTERGGRLTFASEIKALLANDPTLGALSPVALDQYLTLRFVQAPDTFFEAGSRAAPGALPDVGERGRPHRAVLGPGIRPQVDLLRGRDARADRRAARGDRAAAPDERRAGGRVPERRARLDPDRLLRRQGPRPGASHLLDGHSRIGT